MTISEETKAKVKEVIKGHYTAFLTGIKLAENPLTLSDREACKEIVEAAEKLASDLTPKVLAALV